ncbi:MAG: N-acetylmuramic acid 6-phosphate etherase [Rhizobiaceae bacterium]
MALARTEQQHAEAAGLDVQPPETILRILAEAQVQAAAAVGQALPQIAEAAATAADALRGGGRLIYAAAGSSGLMALADALEMPGTFGIARDRVVTLMAGGIASLTDMVGGVEDDAEEAAREISALGVSASDCVFALSASGTTPYAVGALTQAKKLGARTIGIANNAGTPLVTGADIGIVLPTPPEVIAGSTRMGAGTAQKITLNMLSTLVAVHLGHVHDGFMVNLRADNEKLRGRAARIVSAVSGTDIEQARRALDTAGGAVKEAVLLASGSRGADEARQLLGESNEHLRDALKRLQEGRFTPR